MAGNHFAFTQPTEESWLASGTISEKINIDGRQYTAGTFISPQVEIGEKSGCTPQGALLRPRGGSTFGW